MDVFVMIIGALAQFVFLAALFSVKTFSTIVGAVIWTVFLGTLLAVGIREMFWAVQRWRKLL
jgi:hypothetical protein